MITKFTISISDLTITAEVDDASGAPATSAAITEALCAQLAAQLTSSQSPAQPLPAINGHRPIQRRPRRAAAPTTPPATPEAMDLGDTPQATAIPPISAPPAPEPIAVANGTRKAVADAGAVVGLATEKLNHKRMDFHEFDTLVRAEMTRLSPEPGVMPSIAQWDGGRDAVLPTFGTVCARYGCESARSLADKLGLKSPKSGPKPIVTEAA